jgi:hypothetical protein
LDVDTVADEGLVYCAAATLELGEVDIGVLEVCVPGLRPVERGTLMGGVLAPLCVFDTSDAPGITALLELATPLAVADMPDGPVLLREPVEGA